MNPRYFSKSKQAEMCRNCKLPDCNEGGEGCAIRIEIRRLRKIQYYKNIEKSRAKRCKSGMTYEQYENKKKRMREYYLENREEKLMKQKKYDQEKKANSEDG